MSCLCTIITSDFLAYAKILHENLRKFSYAENFSVLVVDEVKIEDKGFQVYSLSNLQSFSQADYGQVKKYQKDPRSSFRWALKPLFLKFLLQEIGHEKLIYIDPDIYFYNDPQFLFDELDENNVLITPHWRSKDPLSDSVNFELLFTGGIYNAGFFGCNEKAIPVLDWWVKACSYKMVKENGMYVDQAFLNLMPVYFPGQVEVITHKGCNVAGWNLVECPRVEKNGEVLIDGYFSVIFIHFTPGTIWEIKSGKDSLLASYLEEYEKSIQKYLPDFSFEGKSKKTSKSTYFNFLRKRNGKSG